MKESDLFQNPVFFSFEEKQYVGFLNAYIDADQSIQFIVTKVSHYPIDGKRDYASMIDYRRNNPDQCFSDMSFQVYKNSNGCDKL